MADKVQLIKGEIERIEQILDDFNKTHNNIIDNGIVTAKKNICKHIKSFIDSLPEEPKCIYNRTLDERKKFCKYCSAACDVRIEEEPASEDLEEEMIRWHREHFDNKRDWEKTSGEYLTRKSQLDLARHFAEWGRNHFEDKSEMVSEDLEEEIDRYYSDWQFDDDTIYEDMRDICRHFAEWQKQRDQETIELAEDHAMLAGMNRMKEEMMENAVEGEEIWKPIFGFEEYEVSNKGRVLSRKQKKDGVLLKQQTNLVGYKYVTLRDKKYNPHLSLVHRLVAEAFIPNPFKKPTVNHIDEDKGNNIVSNLEWATYIEQKNHGSQKRPDVCPSMIDNEGRQSRRLISTRAYLRKCKYIIDDLNMIAYYDDNTRRSKKFEEEKRFYNYKPYNGEKFDRLPFITRPQKTIEVVSDEGVITVYKNISQAAKSLGVSVSLIKRRLDGIGGTSGNFAKLINYTFKYKEE